MVKLNQYRFICMSVCVYIYAYMKTFVDLSNHDSVQLTKKNNTSLQTVYKYECCIKPIYTLRVVVAYR